jgi:CheY-like chemotaxis protein
MAATPKLRSAVILVVDDEKNALNIRKALLEDAGYIVLAMTDTSEALKIVGTKSVDLVLPNKHPW